MPFHQYTVYHDQIYVKQTGCRTEISLKYILTSRRIIVHNSGNRLTCYRIHNQFRRILYNVRIFQELNGICFILLDPSEGQTFLYRKRLQNCERIV